MNPTSYSSALAKYVLKPSLFHSMDVQDSAFLPTLRHLFEQRQYQVANKAYARLKDQSFETRFKAACLIMQHDTSNIIDHADDALLVAFLNKVFLDHLDLFISEASSYTSTGEHFHVCFKYQYRYPIATKIAYWLDTHAIKQEQLSDILSSFCSYQDNTWKDLRDLFNTMSTPVGKIAWQYARDTLFAQSIPRRFHKFAFTENLLAKHPDLLMLCAKNIGENITMQKLTDYDCIYLSHLDKGWDALFTKKNDYGLIIQEQLSIMRTMGSYDSKLLRRSIYGNIEDESFVVPLEAV